TLESVAGFGYTSLDGFRTISNTTETGEGAKLGAMTSKWEHEFGATIEPYFEFGLGLAPSVMGVSGPSFEFLSVTLAGGLELGILSPLDTNSRDYVGPNWQLTGSATLSLDPLASNMDVAEKFFGRIGLVETNHIVELDLTLFHRQRVFAKSPAPQL